MLSTPHSAALQPDGLSPTETTDQPADQPSDHGSNGRGPDGPSGRLARWWRRPRLLAVGLAVLLVVGGVSAKALWPERKADIRQGTTLVDADGLAARYGIDVTLIAVTAAGGLIDFRYQVIDPDKANPIIHDQALFPKLIVEDTGATLAVRSLPHNHKTELELGGNYFFLMANANNAVHQGSPLTLVMGDVRLEHIIAQG